MLMILAICACAAKEPATAAPNSENSQSTTKENADSTDLPDESQENAVTVADPFGKYEPSIDITTMMLEDNIRNVPENMTMDSNPWIDLFKEYGINVSYKISGSASDLDTKLNMAIATEDLPDIMQVTASQFQELSEAGYLADLTEVFETYASPETKAMYMQDGGIMSKMATLMENWLVLLCRRVIRTLFRLSLFVLTGLKNAALMHRKPWTNCGTLQRHSRKKMLAVIVPLVSA